MGGQVRAITQRSDKLPLSLTFNVALATTETEIFMSKLAEFRQLEKYLADQLQALEELKGDAGLKQEIELETKLRALLAKYG